MGFTLLKQRLSAGLTQRQLADLAGVGQDTISHLETGVCVPRPKTMARLAAALDVDVRAIFPDTQRSPERAPDGGWLIPLCDRQGAAVVRTRIDDEDLERISGYSWHRSSGYAVTCVPIAGSSRQRTIFLHRLIVDAPEGCEVDHINGDTLDNRKTNLRFATHALNSQNRPGSPNGTSEFRGVSWDSGRHRWVAVVVLDGTRHWCGAFEDELDAAHAAEAFRLKHMPFAQPDPRLQEAT